jgi:hypothetical protein
LGENIKKPIQFEYFIVPIFVPIYIEVIIIRIGGWGPKILGVSLILRDILWVPCKEWWLKESWQWKTLKSPQEYACNRKPLDEVPLQTYKPLKLMGD